METRRTSGATDARCDAKAEVSFARTGNVPQCMGITALGLSRRAAWAACNPSIVKKPPTGNSAKSSGYSEPISSIEEKRPVSPA